MLSDLPIPVTEDKEEEEIKLYTVDIQETTNNMLTPHGAHLSRTHGAHPLPSHLGSNPPTQCNTRPHIPLLPPKDKTSMLTNILVLHVITTYNRVSNTQQKGTTSSSSKT